MSTFPQMPPDPQDQVQSGKFAALRRKLPWAIALLVLAGLAWLFWQWANDMSGVRREPAKVPAIIPLPPPPPPPPEPPPEPEKPVEEKIVEPEPTPEPEEVKPEEEAPPSPADDLADPMQMDGDAQAGADAFNIGAGKGNGLAGNGSGRLGNGTYSQFLAYSFQRLLRESEELRSLAFRLEVNVWLDQNGRVSRVELDSSSGDSDIDAKVLAVLRASPTLERPPASLTVPVRIRLQGRRPA